MRLRHVMLSAFLSVAVTGSAALARDPAPKAAPPRAEPPKAEPPKVEPPKAPAGPFASADVKGLDGKSLGTAALEETPRGVLITVELAGLPPGEHAFHIHETGKCEAPFKTAGGHFNPEHHKHGIMAADGAHAGDLPNVFASADGKTHFQALALGVTLKKGAPTSLLDADGSALVVHAKADDLMGDPAGNAGDRIACGAVEEKATQQTAKGAEVSAGIKIELTSIPPGADVIINGANHGQTPQVWRRAPPSDAAIVFTLKKKGFKDLDYSIVPNKDYTLELTLQPETNKGK